MAVSELCDNALQHGRNALGAYVAADRVDAERGEFRLAIADLGIGIPEHIRARHPEWQDDTAAIVRALQRGVTGTGDPHRGNGFAEVVDDVSRALVRAVSSVQIEIRSAKGGVVLDLVDGRVGSRPANVERARRGTWITYTVRTIRS
jgi:anti-sigma regulatory factor (Ser/Thr protein kinase)